jgi:two-component system, NarL family, sensor histidine kinase UhpB
MSLKFRLLIYINSLLLVAVIIGISAIITSAQKNVRQEILSTQSLAVFAIENGIERNPEIYLFQEEGQTLGLANLNELRHLKIQFFDIKNQLRDQTSSNLSMLDLAPKWFISIMEDFSTVLPEKRININIRGKKFGYILINPEPMYEYSEIWQQIQNGFWVILLFFGFVNIMIFIVFYHTLKPINSIIDGFQKLEDENYKAKINKINILELDIIGQNFNKMVKKLKESNDKIHKLSQDLINVQEQEKKELARNLHDELGQSLTAIQAEAASIKKNKKEESRIQALDSIIKISKNMMFSTRELIKKLSLGILEEMGFEIAITDLINDWSRRHPKVSINYSYDKNLDGLIPSAFEGRIYRIIQEALTNITKHSNPKNITINFQFKKNKNLIEIIILNDGIKTKLDKQKGFGLSGMIERVNQMNGTINFKKKHNFEICIILKVSK